MKKLILATLAATALSAAAQAAGHPPSMGSPPAGQCFYTRDIHNHTIGDRNTLYLNVNGHDVYRVTMGNNCLSAAMSSDPLIIRNIPSGSAVCAPLDLDVGIKGSRCIVTAITPLSKAEAAALPKKVRP
jgi:hypothetical protein